MSVFMAPLDEGEPWPTLGPLVAQWIEENLCHGPGDLLGRPVTLSDEQLGWIYHMYEIEPLKLERQRHGVKIRERNPRAGRRRFQRCALSLRKGSSKTEFAAWIAAAELHHGAPVRCVGWDGREPIPGPVTDPYIPMIAYTEEQSEELAYGALRRILMECSIGNDFDISLERVLRLHGDGKAEAVSNSPNARDGARTTFQHADETHRFTLDALKRTWTVMLANLAKRPLADPWALETTTAFEPGANSVAESTMDYAHAIVGGRASGRLFFFHRQASDRLDIETEDGLRAAVIDASGPFVAEWTDVDRIVNAFTEPDADRAYLERVWLNRPVQSAGRAFDYEQWETLALPGFVVPEGASITLGFDGGRFDDSTALVGTHVETGYQWIVGLWERPARASADWEVPVAEVDAAVAAAFLRWHVCRMYADPPKWEGWISAWAGRYGEKRVSEWWTNRVKAMAYAIRSFITAITGAELHHSGDKLFGEHIANARKLPTKLVDDQEKPLYGLRKERKDSPKKIDAAVAAVISWEARNDAIAAGEIHPEPAIYFVGGAK